MTGTKSLAAPLVTRLFGMLGKAGRAGWPAGPAEPLQLAPQLVLQLHSRLLTQKQILCRRRSLLPESNALQIHVHTQVWLPNSRQGI